ncbi:MAG TPA: hypothetical protein VFJ70_00725 [Burkholderiales bacterium]|nr:hypothetical protein [Burkholderiales bacterium]
MAGMEKDNLRSGLRMFAAVLALSGRTALRRTMRDCLGIMVLCLLLGYWSTTVAPLPAWLTTGAALAALCVALVCAGRLGVLEFAPEVLAGDVIIPRSQRAGREIKLLLPLQFTNAGSADGIIEWVALRLTIDGDIERSVVLSPVAEVDMQRFIQAKRRLDEHSNIEAFTAFALEAKRALAKFVLFDVAERGRTLPLTLRPGHYAFELFVKSTAHRKPKLERCFAHQIERKHVEENEADAPVYLINYEINLPGARRELAGAEWMPRGARYSN